MNIQILHLVEGAKQAVGLTVVIDVSALSRWRPT